MSLRGKLTHKMMLKRLDMDKPLAALRKDFEDMKVKPLHSEIETVEVNLGTWYIPKHYDGVIYYLHGGGYCLGIYEPIRNHARYIANLTKKKVFLLDYRLSPEHPYPAAVEDMIKGYDYILNQTKPDSVAIYGDSSGCGLALSGLMRLKSRLPAAVVMATPFVDASKDKESISKYKALDPYYTEKYTISDYYVQNRNPKDSEISPLYGDLKGLPPIMIHAAEYDTLQDDSNRLYHKLVEANNNASMKLWKGMWHVFHMNADLIPEARKAMIDFALFIDEHIGRTK